MVRAGEGFTSQQLAQHSGHVCSGTRDLCQLLHLKPDILSAMIISFPVTFISLSAAQICAECSPKCLQWLAFEVRICCGKGTKEDSGGVCSVAAAEVQLKLCIPCCYCCGGVCCPRSWALLAAGAGG